MRVWKVGELSKQTGITVRTLHHHDEIGLLSSSERSRTGYRCSRSFPFVSLASVQYGGEPSAVIAPESHELVLSGHSAPGLDSDTPSAGISALPQSPMPPPHTQTSGDPRG